MTAASDFYASLRAGIKDLISDAGLKSCVVTVTRITSAVPAANTDYTPGSVTSNVYSMDAVVIGVEQEYVDGDLVSADDLQIIAPAYATLNGVESLFEPKTTDEYTIDGVVHVCNKIERIPSSGTATAFFIFVKA
jgi:hypothetical protein